MFLGRLRRLLRVRQRSQGLVEYGVITACLAFAGIVGFNALASAEKTYLQNFPKNVTPPDVSGALLHSVFMDQPTCTVAGQPLANPIPVGTLVKCDTIVYDTYSSNLYERNPPRGTIDWLLDGVSIGICYTSQTLPAVAPYPPSGSTCPSPAFQWTPDATYVNKTGHLVAKFGRVAGDPPSEKLDSNHLTYSTTPITMNFISNLSWNVSCVNDVPGLNLPLRQVEIGHPLRCTVTLIDLSSGSAQPSAGTPVTWTTVNGAGDAGVGVFTCATTSGLTIFTDSTICPKPTIAVSGPVSFTCTTNASGQCSTIYRRLFDNNGKALSRPPLTLSALGASYTYGAWVSGAWTGLQVVGPKGAHGSAVVGLCQPSSDHNVTITSDPPLSPSFHVNASDAWFQATTEIDVTGSTATSTVCTASVFDTDPNPAADNAGNPNLGDAHPPMGIVHFKLHYGATVQEVATCSLVRSDTAALPTQQALGQAPFVSTCQPLVPFTMVGTGPGAYLEIVYYGEPNTADGFAHGPSAGVSFPIPVDFT